MNSTLAEAKVRSVILLALFFILLVLFSFANYFAFVFMIYLIYAKSSADTHFTWWMSQVFCFVSLVTFMIVSFSCLYKFLQLQKGPVPLLLRMNGRLANGEKDPLEQNLINVTDEMALAAGIQAPVVVILPNERGINALALGHANSDAVIAVTAGMLEILERNELQAVVAHEMSHIVNGDSALNLRLLALVHGIVVMAEIGGWLIDLGTGETGSGWAERNPQLGAIISGLGMAITAIGCIGLFFGNTLKFVVSRQREYFADAAAVQYTSNKSGLISALLKIGGYKAHGRVQARAVESVNFALFVDGSSNWLSSMFVTHPPLAARIRRLEPGFDGTFPVLKASRARRAGKASKPSDSQKQTEAKHGDSAPVPSSAISGARVQTPAKAPLRIPLAHGTIISLLCGDRKGPSSAYEQLRQDLPLQIGSQFDSPDGVQAVVISLLLNGTENDRLEQLRFIATHAAPDIHQRVIAVSTHVRRLGPRYRLPLLELSLPLIRQLSQDEYLHFREIVRDLIHNNGACSLFGYLVQRVLLHQVEPLFNVKDGTDKNGINPCSTELIVDSLSAFCFLTSEGDAEQAMLGFMRAAKTLGPAAEALRPNFEDCSLGQFHAAISKLSFAPQDVREQFIASCITSAAAERELSIDKAELLWAVAECFRLAPAFATPDN